MSEVEPKPRRKKRRRPATAETSVAPGDTPGPAAPPPPEPEEDAAPSGEAEEEAESPQAQVPAFARGWPRDGALDALVAAFEAGDYARVRQEAPELSLRTGDDAVRRAARELRRRLDPDPVAVYMLMAAAALLAFLASWYWLHPHTP